MSDGNKRILGDVWINQENLDRQREFFKDIIESYQDKYGGQFDASTLQGLQASDFASATQGVLAEHAIQDPLWLGKKRIANIEDRQYIYTDAIWLDRDTSDINSASYRLAHIDAFNEIAGQENNLTDALVRLYDLIGTKLDESVYNTFLEGRFKDVEDQINETSVEFIDHTTGATRHGVNADLINGIRPILITEEEYNRIKTEGTEEQKAALNYWRNVFIFVDSLPATYNQPWEYSLTDPYSFRVHNGYLQVSNNITDWVDVAELEDLWGGVDFNDIIEDYLRDTSDYVINNTSLLNAISNISPTAINDNQASYPFLSSSLKDDFLHDLTINGEDTYITTSTQNGFKNADMDMTQILKDNQVLKQDGTKRIDDMQTQLNSQGTRIDTTEQSISGINRDISSIRSGDITKIPNLESQITELNNQLNSLKNASTWRLFGREYGYLSDANNGRKYDIRVEYNATHTRVIIWDTRNVSFTGNEDVYSGIVIPDYYRPLMPVSHIFTSNRRIIVHEYEGLLRTQSLDGKSRTGTVYCQFEWSHKKGAKEFNKGMGVQ